MTAQNLAIVDPDASNPYGGRTLRMLQVSTVGGKVIYVSDGMGIEPGTDYVYLSADVYAASGDFYVQGTCYNAAGASTGNIDGTVTTLAGRATLTASAVVPAATVKINVYLVRDAGAADLDIYGMWAHCGYKRSPAMAQDWLTSELTSIRDTHTKFGETHLKYWQLALANIQPAAKSRVTPEARVKIEAGMKSRGARRTTACTMASWVWAVERPARTMPAMMVVKPPPTQRTAART